MKYRHLYKIRLHWVTGMLLAGAIVPLAFASPPMAPLPGELESLVRSLAARRLSVNDFAQSRREWADFHHYRKIEVRVCQIGREGPWARVDFDCAREGKPAKREIFRMAWNEGEEGPAPFARNQRLWIWVSPGGIVDGFELGVAVHRWRHLPDGMVELQVLDEMIDGGTVLVRMIPDRYSGSEVGRTVYWKGEGLCTGAAGTVPVALKIHPDDLTAAQTDLSREGKKTSWIGPGMTSCDDEIRTLLRDFAGPGVVAEAANPGPGSGEPFKTRLRAESSGQPKKKAAERPVSKAGRSGWGRVTAPSSPAKKNAGAGEGALAALFGKGGKEKEKAKTGKPAAQEKPDSVPNQGETPANPQPESANPAAVPPPVTTVAEKPRFDERWFEALREKAQHYRKQAFEALSGSRSPGSFVSQTWVDVKYEGSPGEPLRAVAETLPLVPKKQFVPEWRAMP